MSTKPAAAHYPYPSIDVASRYQLIQLRVTNFGGSAAFDIRVKWKVPLTNSKGEQIRFTRQEAAPDIPILLPKESVTILIDDSAEFFKASSDANYSGEIEFADSSKKRYSHAFFVSAEKYRESLTFDNEELFTNRQLQKLPEAIKDLTSQVTAIRKRLELGTPS